MYAKVKRLEKMFVFAVEVIIVIISLVIAYLIRYGVVLGVDSFFDQNLCLLLILVIFLIFWNISLASLPFFHKRILKLYLIKRISLINCDITLKDLHKQDKNIALYWGLQFEFANRMVR